MKRILCLILALTCCLPLLVACGDDVKLDLVQDGTVTILYDANLQTEQQMDRLAKAITTALDVEVNVVSSESFPLGIRANPNTILIGNLALDTSVTALEALRSSDFTVGVYGDFYILGAKTSKATDSAVAYFKNNVLETLNGSMTVSSLDNYTKVGEYDINSMTVNNTPIYKYQIVIPQSATITEKRFAADLQTLLIKKTGYTLEVVKKNAAKADGYQIRIGSVCTKAKATDAHTYAAAVNGTALELRAESYYAYDALCAAIDKGTLASSLTDVALAEDYTLSGNALTEADDAYIHHGTIRLMFNNIWGGSNEGGQRTEMLAELYGEYLPDVLGLQECAPSMRETLIERLVDLGYTEIPTDRNFVPFSGSETETRDPIFYRADVVELVDYGYHCLAVIPEVDEVRDTGYAAAIQNAKNDKSKSVNWAIFRVKATGELFMAGSVHLWWQSSCAADDAIRTVQMRSMRETLSAAAAAYLERVGLSGSMPIFIGGDYNAHSERNSYKSMTSGTAAFQNVNNLMATDKQLSFDTHHVYPEYNEKTGFWEAVAASGSGSYVNAIDHIFVNSAAIMASSFQMKHLAIAEDEYAYASSDHNAIFCDIGFTANTPKQPAAN